MNNVNEDLNSLVKTSALKKAKEENSRNVVWINDKGIRCSCSNPDYIESPEEKARRIEANRIMREHEQKRMFSGTQYKEVGEGWHSFVKPLEEFCVANGIAVVQVKEKFSSLRFYINTPDDMSDELRERVYGWIEHAEELSSMFCEICGDTAYQAGKNWLKTYCAKHHEERK